MEVATCPNVAATCNICIVDVDLMKYICDFLDIRSTARLVQACKSLRCTLFEYLVKRTILWHKNTDVDEIRHQKCRPPNPIVTAIKSRWQIDVIGRVIEIAHDLHSPMLDGTDKKSYKVDDIPPVFVAVEEDRLDILSLLEAKGANLDIRAKRVFLWMCKCKTRFKNGDHVYHKAVVDPTYNTASPFKWCLEGQNHCGNIIDIAVERRNLGLTTALLAKPDLPVSYTAVTRALIQGWLPGFHAIVASGRVSKSVVQLELTEALCQNRRTDLKLGYPKDTPAWVEALITLGADAEPRLPDVDNYQHGTRSALESMLIRNWHQEQPGVLKLLDLVKFSHSTVVMALRICVLDDCFLDVTKKILSENMELAASACMTAFESAFRNLCLQTPDIGGNPWNLREAFLGPPPVYRPNQQTVKFLIQLLGKLLKIGKTIDLSQPLSSKSPYTLLEYATQATAVSTTDVYLPSIDWTIALLRVGVPLGPPEIWACQHHYRSSAYKSVAVQQGWTGTPLRWNARTDRANIQPLRADIKRRKRAMCRSWYNPRPQRPLRDREWPYPEPDIDHRPIIKWTLDQGTDFRLVARRVSRTVKYRRQKFSQYSPGPDIFEVERCARLRREEEAKEGGRGSSHTLLPSVNYSQVEEIPADSEH
ncbi:hypothetical protein GGR57DRAFT_518963 [Xylariaceae sp. FL1272]|nr:hypothetical protein GGR57DRAFT_518963 [Xylariaceae sp. FL1272]